nr:MAG TPA: hypothetical protein [Caudoviricetes sp.]
MEVRFLLPPFFLPILFISGWITPWIGESASLISGI